MLRTAVARNSLLLSIVAVGLGGLAIYIGCQFGSPWREIVAAWGAAVLGAGGLALITRLSLRGEHAELIRQTNIRQALSDAFRTSENLREDALGLGVSRIIANLSDLQRQVPLEGAVAGAKIVYIMGTTVTRTSILKTLFQNNSDTKFRVIFVDESAGSDPHGVILRALGIIHDVQVQGKILVAETDLRASAEDVSNLEYKKILCVPTFSAVLALWREDDKTVKGWLQVDHYLIRTRSDARLWLVLEHQGEPGLLFKRYQNLVEEMWRSPDRYDISKVSI